MNESPDKRVHCRNSAMIQGAFRPLDLADRNRLFCSTIDISNGGLRIRSQRQPVIKKGDDVMVSIHCDEPPGLIDVQGQVRWLKQRVPKKDGWDIGVRLSEAELAKWALWMEDASTIFDGLTEA